MNSYSIHQPQETIGGVLKRIIYRNSYTATESAMSDKIAKEPTTTKSKAKKEAPKYTLTARDIQVLTYIAEMYSTRLDVIQRLLGVRAGKGSKEQSQQGILTENRTARIIAKWRAMGLVETRKIVGDEPPYTWCTSKGLRAVGLDYRETPPALATVKHYHQVNIVRLYVENRNPTATWQSERALRGEVESMDAKERKGKHTPDGVLIFPSLHKFAIEIELTRKSNERLAIITTQLARDYEGVLYFVNDTTNSPVQEAVKAHGNKFTLREISKISEEVNING